VGGLLEKSLLNSYIGVKPNLIMMLVVYYCHAALFLP